MAPRRATPDAVLDSDVLGLPVELRADGQGVVQPLTPDQVRLADALGLPIIRQED